MTMNRTHLQLQGFTMIEVLVTLVILAFGILGLANLQGKMHMSSMEGYQRSQANLLLQDMVNRIYANRQVAAAYVTATPAGVDDSQPTSCTGIAMGPGRDLCEWSNALKGAAEVDNSNNVGAMIGARGCVEQVQVPNLATCTPGRYRVSVVWQGLHQTAAPDASLTCAAASYGDESYRRILTSVVTIGMVSC